VRTVLYTEPILFRCPLVAKSDEDEDEDEDEDDADPINARFWLFKRSNILTRTPTQETTNNVTSKIDVIKEAEQYSTYVQFLYHTVHTLYRTV
jgi:hypothetical protein